MDKREEEFKRQQTAKRIRELREKMDWTQERMAETAGLTLDNYKKIEDGSNAMSISSLRKVQNAFGVSFDYLLEGKQETTEEICNNINACDAEEKALLLIKLILGLTRVKLDEKKLKDFMYIEKDKRLKEEKGEQNENGIGSRK